jgi:hypothetical protein
MLRTGTISSVSQKHHLQPMMWMAVDNSKHAWHGDDRARLIHVPYYYCDEDLEDSSAACIPRYRPHDNRAEPCVGKHALLGVRQELELQHFVLERTFFTCRDDATRTMGFVDDETFVKHLPQWKHFAPAKYKRLNGKFDAHRVDTGQLRQPGNKLDEWFLIRERARDGRHGGGGGGGSSRGSSKGGMAAAGDAAAATIRSRRQSGSGRPRSDSRPRTEDEKTAAFQKKKKALAAKIRKLVLKQSRGR